MLTFLLAASFAETPEIRVSREDVWIRDRPDASATRVGMLAAGAPFRTLELAEGPGCTSWGALDPTGWACLDYSEPTDRTVETLPVLLDYQPPDPRDFDRYVSNGKWTRPEGTDLLPFVYGRVWKQWKAPLYTSAAAWEAGEPHIGHLPAGRRARFVGVETTSRGIALVREDGTIVPEESVYVFPITRFQGRDLRVDAVPDGHVPAWVVRYAGLEAEGPEGTVAMPYHTPLSVQTEPVDGYWQALVDGTPVRIPVGQDLRVWRPGERPDDVGDTEQWLDVDPQQQTLGVLEGDTLIYATLVSTGLWSTPTPSGVYRITDKRAWADMRSRSDAASPYHVEAVPWIFHFRPRYALHGAYWHWGFGNRASHGCINLALRDAQWLFETIDPELPEGWHSVYATEDRPGTVLRVR